MCVLVPMAGRAERTADALCHMSYVDVERSGVYVPCACRVPRLCV